ncbi:hypothetical protein PFISCL1PPCAC_12239 [Pristionchus fissidentatus]|uniref:RING-type domain-containing protein n=1 Tax=Pristionchus fissidentatus TaxID=1538716 RepID=A0AAV5VQI0_9BILA|nr:hypothetical protein PFISCL1PPCAC_12239 [Pristionchus fissidentatus]
MTRPACYYDCLIRVLTEAPGSWCEECASWDAAHPNLLSVTRWRSAAPHESPCGCASCAAHYGTGLALLAVIVISARRERGESMLPPVDQPLCFNECCQRSVSRGTNLCEACREYAICLVVAKRLAEESCRCLGINNGQTVAIDNSDDGRFTRRCGSCRCDNPGKLVVFILCGHVSCSDCVDSDMMRSRVRDRCLHYNVTASGPVWSYSRITLILCDMGITWHKDD